MSSVDKEDVPKGESKPTEQYVDGSPEDQPRSELQVKSANDWEHADLGDASRKEKFLKLMGAAKEEHKGKIVIGEDNTPKHKGDPDKLNKGLEEQFKSGLDHKLKSGYKGHLGLGFEKEEEKPKEDVKEGGDTEKPMSNQDVTVKGSEEEDKDTEKAAAGEKHKPAAGDTSKGESQAPKKKMMMNFVKASDS